MRLGGRARFALLMMLAAGATPAAAQFPAQARPHLDWRSASTAHFDFHYPAEMERWTLDVAARMDAVHTAVSRLIGWSPPRRIQVIVDDPYNLSNGSAWPLVDAPAMLLWPTPPDPSSLIGHSRGWGEMLAVHEYAHLAHLTRPSRNPLRRLVFSLLPVSSGPIPLKAPRWVFEGYATVVEGALTGSGRPYGVMRPAMLRQRALEGRLPSYAQLDAFDTYAGGAMAYLAGSAYLEWLIARGGDSSMVYLWRRLSAREDRGFGEAFAGVFGDGPSALYGRFAAEMTSEAVAIEDSLRAAGLVTGDTMLALTYGTGAPSVSPDDSLLAAVVRFRDAPPRLVVWETAIDTAAVARRARDRERLLRADPLDVPAVQTAPPPRRRVAELAPAIGMQYEAPRFLPDGRRLLVHRLEPSGDGTWRGDLAIWDLRDGSVRRVTHGAGVSDAAPTADGRNAIAIRCANGICDLVSVNLATGAVTVVAEGSFDAPWAHPAPSPDDRWIAAARPADGRWQILLVDRQGVVAPRVVSPRDGASRYHPAWVVSGPLAPGLIVVSELGGIANLEWIDLAGDDGVPRATRSLTRVTGGVLAPSVPRGGHAVYFLSMHADGLDVQRLALADSARPGSLDPQLQRAARIVRLPARLTFVAPRPPLDADTLSRGAVRQRGGYGVGPRRYDVWPVAGGGAGGGYGGLALVSGDPVGRLTMVLQGVIGARESWQGGALSASWRGMRPAITASLHAAEQRPSAQSHLQPSGLDVRWRGASVIADLPIARNGWSVGGRAGGSAGVIDAIGEPHDATRATGFVEIRGQVALRRGTRSLAVGGIVHGETGRSGDAGWHRGVGTFAASAAAGGRAVRASIAAGAAGGDLPPFEAFVVGGLANPLLDRALLRQRISHAALPLGVTSGSEVLVWSVATDVAGAEAYLWNASARGWRNEQHRLIGIEWDIADARLPIINVPGVAARAGVGYSIDAPFRRELRVYGGLTIAP